MGRRLTGSAELSGPVLDVAPQLLGALLTAGGVQVRLTEVEAYGGADDPGSHAHRGRTPRTQVMFGPAGHAYVYFSYGMHWCLNVVAGPTGEAAAVLLRAGAVVGGLAAAHERRPGASQRDLCRGPARLCRALGISGAHDGADLLDPAGAVHLSLEATVGGRVHAGPRVGVSRAAQRPWRFWLDGEPTVSAYRAAAQPRHRAPSPP